MLGRMQIQAYDSSFSINFGSRETLKVSIRCGFNPCARHIRRTLVPLTPATSVRVRAPMSGIGRCGLRGQTHSFHRMRCEVRPPRGRSRSIAAIAPPECVLPQFRSDLRVIFPLPRQQHDPGARRQPYTRCVRARQLGQRFFFFRCQQNLRDSSHQFLLSHISTFRQDTDISSIN